MCEEAKDTWRHRYEHEMHLKNTSHERIPLLQWVIGDFERGKGQLERDENTLKKLFEGRYRELQERTQLTVDEVFS